MNKSDYYAGNNFKRGGGQLPTQYPLTRIWSVWLKL